MARVKVGNYTGTGAAINIPLGWTPDYIHVWNATDGDASWDWFNGLGSGDVLATANHASTQQSLVTSNGIDLYAGSAAPGSEAAEGFTVGTALSESTKVFRYIAIAEDE